MQTRRRSLQTLAAAPFAPHEGRTGLEGRQSSGDDSSSPFLLTAAPRVLLSLSLSHADDDDGDELL